jgi:hypothetical protein
MSLSLIYRARGQPQNNNAERKGWIFNKKTIDKRNILK